MSQHFGKYRGTVVDNADPLQLGRIRALVPAVAGDPTGWALPCVPVAAMTGGVLAVPAIGSSVWIEFEQGDAGYPVWVGAFWTDPAELPSLPGSCRLEVAGGASIAVSDAGIMISNGRGAVIALAGPTVDINNGALTVS